MHSFAPFSNLNFFVKNRQNVFAIELMNFINSIANNSNFAFFLRIFDEFFSGFRAKFQKIVTCVAFSIKFAKTNQKFAENSEFCENYSLLFKIIHFTPYFGILQLTIAAELAGLDGYQYETRRKSGCASSEQAIVGEHAWKHLRIISVF